MGGPPEDWKRGRIPQVEAWGLRGTQTLTLAHSCGTARWAVLFFFFFKIYDLVVCNTLELTQQINLVFSYKKKLCSFVSYNTLNCRKEDKNPLSCFPILCTSSGPPPSWGFPESQLITHYDNSRSKWQNYQKKRCKCLWWCLLFVCLVLCPQECYFPVAGSLIKTKDVSIYDHPAIFMSGTDSQVLSYLSGSGKLKPVF